MAFKLKKRFWLAAAGLLLAGAFYGLHAAAEIATGYCAKVLCSAVFVSEREADVGLSEELADFPYVSVSIDTAAGSVTATVAGLVTRTAIYREGLGATLTTGVSEDTLREEGQRFIAKWRRHGGVQGSYAQDLLPLPERLRVQMDTAALASAMNYAFAEDTAAGARRTRAVAVLCRGYLAAEQYAPGITSRSRLAGWSMTKSVTNALVGICVRKGLLALDERELLPEWQGDHDRRGLISLSHLMHMSSGLSHEEGYKSPFSDAVQMLFNSFSASGYAAARELADEPGSRWYYSSGTTNIICRIIRSRLEAAAIDHLSFPHDELFDVIGMSGAVMEPDPSGTFVGSSFMLATARQWARFGQLYLEDGMWQGRRILPEGWVAYSSTPAPAADRGQYGAHFWLNSGHASDDDARVMQTLPADLFYASGYEGQYVCIFPSRDLVVVRLGQTARRGAFDLERFLADIVQAFSRQHGEPIQ